MQKEDNEIRSEVPEQLANEKADLFGAVRKGCLSVSGSKLLGVGALGLFVAISALILQISSVIGDGHGAATSVAIMASSQQELATASAHQAVQVQKQIELNAVEATTGAYQATQVFEQAHSGNIQLTQVHEQGKTSALQATQVYEQGKTSALQATQVYEQGRSNTYLEEQVQLLQEFTDFLRQSAGVNQQILELLTIDVTTGPTATAVRERLTELQGTATWLNMTATAIFDPQYQPGQTSIATSKSSPTTVSTFRPSRTVPPSPTPTAVATTPPVSTTPPSPNPPPVATTPSPPPVATTPSPPPVATTPSPPPVATTPPPPPAQTNQRSLIHFAK